MAFGLPRGWLGDTLALYARCFRKGAVLALRNWPVGLVIVVYGVLIQVAMVVAGAFGVLGGLLVYLTLIACFSSWLALVAQVLRVGRVRLADVPAGFSAYFWDLLTVGFIFSLLSFVATHMPPSFVRTVFVLAMAVFLNAVPELVYVGRHAATEVFVESYRFIGENWIEWFPANLVLVACVAVVFALPEGPFGLLFTALLGLVLYFGMIVRGLLFQELASSNRRGREFRRRAAG